MWISQFTNTTVKSITDTDHGKVVLVSINIWYLSPHEKSIDNLSLSDVLSGERSECSD
jgi:hypothetical protein